MTAPWLAFAKALRDAAQAEKDFQETQHTDAATTLWLAASQMVSLCDRAILAGVAAAEAVDYDPAASKDHGEAKLAERDALLVRAEAVAMERARCAHLVEHARVAANWNVREALAKQIREGER